MNLDRLATEVGVTLEDGSVAIRVEDLRALLWTATQTSEWDGYALEWGPLVDALDVAEEVMVARGRRTGSYSTEEFAPVLRRALMGSHP